MQFPEHKDDSHDQVTLLAVQAFVLLQMFVDWYDSGNDNKLLGPVFDQARALIKKALEE